MIIIAIFFYVFPEAQLEGPFSAPRRVEVASRFTRVRGRGVGGAVQERPCSEHFSDMVLSTSFSADFVPIFIDFLVDVGALDRPKKRL